jgi:TolA-binding protein
MMKRLRSPQYRKIVFFTLIVATGLLASLPFAEASKRKQTGDSGVERELRFKEGDESGNEVKALKTELMVIKSEKKALDQLLRLLTKHTGTRMESELLFRLGELYMRRARSERFFEMHRNSEKIMTFAPLLVKEASESAEIRKAIAHYDRIYERFPRFHSMDIVLFNNAYANLQIGEDKIAEQRLSALIKEHGDSTLVPDAYLSLGELHFKARNFQAALESFKAVRRFPKARVYPYGIYKTAWTYYNLQDGVSGLKELEDVIVFGREVAIQGWDSKLDLRKEALGDLAVFYSEVRSAQEAVDYLRAQAREIDASPYVMRLAEIYKRHSRHNDVELLLTDLLAKMPGSEATASAHEELVWNYDRTKRQSKAIEQLVAFDLYCDSISGVSGASGISANPTQEQCRQKISDASKKFATKWHGIWKKAYGLATANGGAELYASAEKSYRLYLKSTSSKNPEIHGVRYTFAELLFAQGQYREASDLYASLEDAQKTGLKLDPKIAHDAGYAAVVSLEKSVKDDKWNDGDEKRFHELSDAYIRRHPSGQYVLDLRFKRAFIAYEKEHYDEAASQFKKIGWAKENLATGGVIPEKIVKAQDLYLDILNHKKDFSGIKEAARELLASAAGARSGQVEKVYREAYFAEIQLQEEKGDLASAVESYKKFALENATSDLAPKAWWNASQLQFRIGDATGGANTCYQMHRLFPNSSNGKECLNKAARTFEAMGRLDNAARVLLNLAEVEGEDQEKWRELAADFFALSGSQARAMTMYQKLAEVRKTNAQQLPLLEKAATLARETGDLKTLAEIEGQYTSKGIEPQASRLVTEQAEHFFEKGDLTKAFSTAKRVIGKDGLPKELYARARFVQARVLEDEYRKQSVKARMERIGFVLAIKTEKLEKAQKAYQSAIHYGEAAVSVKALKRLGDCYIDYAKTVRAMSLSVGVAEADQKAFKTEIEQLAVPMEEKGIESTNQALETAKKAQLREGQIGELQAEVDRLNLKPVGAIVAVVVPQRYLPEFRQIASGKEMVK